MTVLAAPSTDACVCVCVLQKIEARVAADEDLKLADLLKYYLRESQAAKVHAAPPAAVWRVGRLTRVLWSCDCCRTSCTAGAGRWWTMRTPTRLWTKLGPRTGTSCRPRPASSSAATSLRRSPSRPSRVSPLRCVCCSGVCVCCSHTLPSVLRAHRLQDQTSGGVQEEPGGAG